MNLRRFFWIVGGLAASIVLTVTALVCLWYWRESTLPIYTLSYQGGTLRYKDRVYSEAFDLQPMDDQAHWQIGKTGDDMQIYALDNDPDHTYVVLRGFMFPDVLYRDTQAPEWVPTPDTIREVRLLKPGRWNPQIVATADKAIIAEVMASLGRDGNKPNGANEVIRFQLYLISAASPQIGYPLNVIVDSAGDVYLATTAAPDQWLATGPLFIDWFKQN